MKHRDRTALSQRLLGSWAGWSVVFALFAGGCGGTWHFDSVSRVTLDQPVTIHGKIALESPPVADGGPVRRVPLGPGTCDAGAPTIALVDVDGLLANVNPTGPYSLGENTVALFREKLDAIAAASDVRAVVLRINSPGGDVTATDIMWHDLHRFRERTRLPVVACLMDLGTGGAYYLATAADQIIAHPTTVAGGIGVILNLYNLRDTMRYFNVIEQPIRAGPLVDMGSSTRKLTPEAEKLLQQMADEFHRRFEHIVRAARPQLQDDGTVFDGRVFTATRALELRLVDRLGYLDDAVAAAGQLAQVGQANLVVFRRANDPAHSPYALTPNVPLQGHAWPLSIPGLDRSRLPAFMYIWQPEATLEKLRGQ